MHDSANDCPHCGEWCERLDGLNAEITAMRERLRQIDSDQYLPSIMWDRDAIDMVWALKLLARSALKGDMPTCCRSDEPLTRAVLDQVKAK